MALGDIILTFAKIFLTVALMCWIVFAMIWAYVKFFTLKRKVWFKFKILRKSYKDEYVRWCMDAVERNLSEFTLRQKLLLGGTDIKTVEEIIYIFNQTRKEMKGGIKQDDRFKKGNGAFKLPEV